MLVLNGGMAKPEVDSQQAINYHWLSGNLLDPTITGPGAHQGGEMRLQATLPPAPGNEQAL